MKQPFFILVITFCLNQCFGQVSNVKAGLWSDPSVWNNNQLPSATDDVMLNFDIIVDVNAVVQSLTLNGHQVVVNSNVNLGILGDDNTTLLSKYIELDTTIAAPFDTAYKILFYYDSAKRNNRIDFLSYRNGELANRQFQSRFFYHNNDTVPYKKVATSPFLSPGDEDYINDTCFYFYANSVIVKDSVIQTYDMDKYVTVNKYAYTDSSVITTSINYSFDPISSFTTEDTAYVDYVNGNIVKQNGDSSFGNNYDYSFVYDNHPNPFARTQSKIEENGRLPLYSIETFVPDIFATNNALEIKQIMHTPYFFVDLKCQYEYKTNGYPRIVRIHDKKDQAYSKGLYFYTK